MLQYVAVCCIVLQGASLGAVLMISTNAVLQCVAVCVAVRCNVLHCVTVCCSVLQFVAVCCSVLQCVAVQCIEGGSLSATFIIGVNAVLQRVAVRCNVLQCVAVCCSVFQRVAVCYNKEAC